MEKGYEWNRWPGNGDTPDWPAPGVAKGFSLLSGLRLEPPAREIATCLPRGGAVLSFRFTLAKAYHSRDDRQAYWTENPVRREWVTGVPMVAGSTWKGNLRAAAHDLLVEMPETQRAARRAALRDLFGDEKGHDESNEERRESTMTGYLDRAAGKAPQNWVKQNREGRVHCLPSYFSESAVDMINPRERTTRKGSNPIKMEVVPAGREARFTLVYVPFDTVGKEGVALGDEELGRVLAGDWALIGAALAHLLDARGFGAKRSTGFGKARGTLKELELHCALTQRRAAPATVAGLKELGQCFGGGNDAR